MAGILDVLVNIMSQNDPNFIKGVEIIAAFTKIDDDFGKKVAEAPHENYDEILMHLEKVNELLGGKK